MKNILQKIITLDPGRTTGAAVFIADFPLGSGRHDLRTKQLGPQLHHSILWDLLTFEKPDIVVCERFMFRQKLGADLIASEYIGIVTLWCDMFNVPLQMQTPAQAKNFVPNRRLHELNLYETKVQHAMDAVRHLVYYVTVTVKDPWFLLHNNANE